MKLLLGTSRWAPWYVQKMPKKSFQHVLEGWSSWSSELQTFTNHLPQLPRKSYTYYSWILRWWLLFFYNRLTDFLCTQSSPSAFQWAYNNTIHKILRITNWIVMLLTEQHQYTFPQACNQNSMHLTLVIYRLHYPKTYSVTSSVVPMPQERYNWG